MRDPLAGRTIDRRLTLSVAVSIPALPRNPATLRRVSADWRSEGPRMMDRDPALKMARCDSRIELTVRTDGGLAPLPVAVEDQAMGVRLEDLRLVASGSN